MKLAPAQMTTIAAAIDRSQTGKPDITVLAEKLNVGYSLAKRMVTAARREMAKPKRPTKVEKLIAAAAALMAEVESESKPQQ